MEAGYYWLRSHWSGKWVIGRYDGTATLCWSFVGSLQLWDLDEVVGDPDDEVEKFAVGPRIPAPACE